MERDTKPKNGAVDGTALPTSTETTPLPSLILQAIGGASLESLSAHRATLNHALEEHRQGNYSKAESILLKLRVSLERSISARTGGSEETAEPSLLLASATTALGRVYMQRGQNQEA